MQTHIPVPPASEALGVELTICYRNPAGDPEANSAGPLCYSLPDAKAVVLPLDGHQTGGQLRI